MRTNKFRIVVLSLFSFSLAFVSCSKDENSANETSAISANKFGVNFSGTFVQQDQMARPAINTVFIKSGAPKDAFNAAIPSEMGTAYRSIFESRLLALNPGYTTNALGLTASQFTGILSTDVLNVSKTAPTTFFDGTNVLTGRALADDVIDTELLLIFGGPTGASNPTLTSDNVNANDKAFSNKFPYLASAW
ncbi:DUF4331 family protein [Flavobacterium soyangense]|uniref:DUF4331 family protein n=1 Tax=Flavobacterium soyangense TaxID=2023265 RepID=A0A930U8Y9_9FLAO|nr:DUF4331 family protein [Flavobacterium soyangense]MBF2707675.1 DUF4331 family protein [Flavobacterium soyangense]